MKTKNYRPATWSKIIKSYKIRKKMINVIKYDKIELKVIKSYKI